MPVTEKRCEMISPHKEHLWPWGQKDLWLCPGHDNPPELLQCLNASKHLQHEWAGVSNNVYLCCGVVNEVVPEHDPVNHPSHYTSHPSGVECIDITRHMSFNIGNVIKYLWRAGLKGEAPAIQDLKKALWYLQDEIAKQEKETND